LAGKAMSDKPILTFARQWDGQPYVTKVDVASIKEVRDDTLGRVTYEFNLVGQGSPNTLELPQRTLPKVSGEGASGGNASGGNPLSGQLPLAKDNAAKPKATAVRGLG